MKIIQVFALIMLLFMLGACFDADYADKHDLQKSERASQTHHYYPHDQTHSTLPSLGFINGVLISGVFIALFIGVALGSQAQHDSLHPKEETMHDEKT